MNIYEYSSKYINREGYIYHYLGWDRLRDRGLDTHIDRDKDRSRYI